MGSPSDEQLARRTAMSEATAPLQLGEELRNEPRLAAAGIADQADNLRAARFHAGESGQQAGKLIVASDHRSGEAECREPARRPGLGQYPAQ